MSKMALLRALRRVNAMHYVCDRLFGDDHTHRERMAMGFVVMCIGVTIAKSGELIHFEFVRFVLDGAGYLVHGIGTVPYAEALVAVAAKAAD